jgi:hypothetical protein
VIVEELNASTIYSNKTGGQIMRVGRTVTSVFSVLVVCLITNVQSMAQSDTTMTAVKDNTLYESVSGSLSNGAGMHFFAGKNNQNSIRRGILAFDVASRLPTGSTIDSVKLTLNMSKTVSSGTTVSLHRVEADWGEGSSVGTGGGGGEGGGGTSSTDDATWIHTFFNTANWTNAGGDFSATVSASQTVAGIGTYTWGSTPQMVADVQDWLDNPTNDFGWILIGNESQSQTSKRFDSKENPTDANRPKLTVYYKTSTAVLAGEGATPTEYGLLQNYPNPFNPSSTITYSLKQNTSASLRIYDLQGREVKTLVDSDQTAGTHGVEWDGTDNLGKPVSSGIFVYRLTAGAFSKSAKMMLLR